MKCECCGQTDLTTAIIDHGQREEFHQKHPEGNRYMAGYHKSKRLELEALSRSMTPAQREAWSY